MSNYLRNNEEAAPGAVRSRNRQRLWLATGAVGLAGAVTLGAVGVAAAGAPNLANLNWAGAKTVLTDGAAGGDQQGTEGRKGGQPGNSDGQQGKGREGQGQEGQEGKGQDGWPTPPSIAVPCNRDALFSAITEANQRQQPATLQLAKGCTYDLRTQTAGTALPPITARLSIVGEKSTIERAYGTPVGVQFRLFQVDNGGHLTLKGVTLRNGSAAGPGGAILVNAGGEAVIEDSHLTANSATGATGNGGAISNAGVTTIKRSKLTLNNAAGSGGAIDSTGALFVEETLFEANSTNSPVTVATTPGGGAVQSSGPLVVTKSKFLGNRSSGNGGGLQVAGGIADVTKTEFVLNEAAFAGGGIAVATGAQLRAEEVKLVENVAGTVLVTPLTVGGGGIYNAAGGTVTLHETKLIGNTTAAGPGGGILNLGSLVIHDGYFAENRAAGTGGGLHNSASGTARLDDTTLRLNQASDGGGIYNAGPAGSVTIDVRSRVFENDPNNCAGTAITNCQ